MRWIVTVRGNRSDWGIEVPKETADAMREDGFDVIEVANTVPAWVADLGLAWVWCAFQDVWDWPSRVGRR